MEEQLAAVQDLDAVLERLDAEQDELNTTIADAEAHADELEVRAALVGSAPPPEAAKLRASATAARQRLAAAVAAHRITTMTKQTRQQLEAQARAEAQAIETRAAVAARNDAVRAMDGFVEAFLRRLVGIRNAAEAADIALEKARALMRAGVMPSGTDLGEAPAVRETWEQTHDRKTGAPKDPTAYEPEQLTQRMRQMYDQALIEFARGEAEIPAFLERWRIWREYEARAQVSPSTQEA